MSKNKNNSDCGNYRFFDITIPRSSLLDQGVPSNVAYEILHDHLNLDGNPSLNLASFVTTWMESEADKLIQENIGKNFVNVHEYPKTHAIEKYCINILADLFHAPKDSKNMGSSTIGSSEAIMLGLLAHKWNWKNQGSWIFIEKL